MSVLGLVLEQSKCCVCFVSVLIAGSIYMFATICNNNYESLVLGEDINHFAGLRTIRLRRRFYISLLPQQLVHIPSSASVPSGPSPHSYLLRRVFSLPTRDDDCEEILGSYLRRVLRLPTRDGKLSELLRSKTWLLLWVVFQGELVTLAFTFYHSRKSVLPHLQQAADAGFKTKLGGQYNQAVSHHQQTTEPPNQVVQRVTM